MLGPEKTDSQCWCHGVCALVSPLCSWQKSCATQQAMGCPTLPCPGFCMKGEMQESRREHPRPQSHCSAQACTQPESQRAELPSDFAPGACSCVLSFTCLFSGGFFAALSLSWFLTDLGCFYCSLPACWQNNKVWGIYVPQLLHGSGEQSLLLRRGSFC